MAKKVNNIRITQQNGNISIQRNGEFEKSYNFNKICNNVITGNTTPIQLANMVAEIINDSLNCKTAVSTLKDYNETCSYWGTYFENIDHFEDV